MLLYKLNAVTKQWIGVSSKMASWDLSMERTWLLALTRFKIDGFIVRTFLPRNSRVSLSIHRTTLINGWYLQLECRFATRQDTFFKMNSLKIRKRFFFSFYLKNNLVKKLLKRPTMKYPLDEIFLRRGKIYSANIVAKTVCDVCIGVKRLKVIPFQGIVSRARATIHERNVQWKI